MNPFSFMRSFSAWIEIVHPNSGPNLFLHRMRRDLTVRDFKSWLKNERHLQGDITVFCQDAELENGEVLFSIVRPGQRIIVRYSGIDPTGTGSASGDAMVPSTEPGRIVMAQDAMSNNVASGSDLEYPRSRIKVPDIPQTAQSLLERFSISSRVEVPNIPQRPPDQVRKNKHLRYRDNEETGFVSESPQEVFSGKQKASVSNEHAKPSILDVPPTTQAETKVSIANKYDSVVWIKDGFQNISGPEAELQNFFHQPYCAHKIQGLDERSNKERAGHVDSDQFEKHVMRKDMQTQVSYFCGIAGVIPEYLQPLTPRGVIDLSISGVEETSMYVRYENGADRLPSQLREAFRGLRSAAITLQQTGFCCDQFTVLTTTENYFGGPGISKIRMNTIRFNVLDRLSHKINQLRSEYLYGTAIIQSDSICENIMKIMFPTLLRPSTTEGKLHFCALTIQFLCLGIVFYAQSHTGSHQSDYVAKPPSRITIQGSGFDNQHIIAEQFQLACMEEVVGDKVWAFRMPDQFLREDIKGLYLSATCEDLVDCWGPGSFILPNGAALLDDSLYGLVIRGGIIQPSETSFHGDRLFHWIDAFHYKPPTWPEAFSYRARITIGAMLSTATSQTVSGSSGNKVENLNPIRIEGAGVSMQTHYTPVKSESGRTSGNGKQESTPSLGPEPRQSNLHDEAQQSPPGGVRINSNCPLNIDESRAASQNDLDTLGTSRPCWRMVSLQGVLQGGYQVVGQIGAQFERQRGVTLKEALLIRWNFGKNLLDFERPLGLQVSLCTGVARRVPLRTIVLENLMEHIDSNSDDFEGWEELKPFAMEAMASKRGFDELVNEFNNLNNKDPRKAKGKRCLQQVFSHVLNCLKETGFDRNGNTFSILWPYKSHVSDCVKIERKNHKWCPILEESEWCTTFAVVTDKCFTTQSYGCRKRGTASWEGLRTLYTSMHLRTVGQDRSATREHNEKQWCIEDGRWYWCGKNRSKFGFIASKATGRVTRLSFVEFREKFVLIQVSQGFTPWWKWDNALVEINNAGTVGEDVFIH